VDLTYWVDLQVPWFARLVEVDVDLVVVDSKLGESNVNAMGVGTTMVGVESNLVVVAAHDVGC
jgi:hypothetical protein